MSKIVLQTHIRGEAGVIKFAEYCNKHNPYIIFREVVKNDFGVDGEIELTRVNEERKIEPMGEILKVQIKTNGTDNSYMRNDQSGSFEFYPRPEDVEYWERYKKNGIEVLLIIYDVRSDSLYAKKLIDTDLYIGKESVKGTKRQKSAITFDKKENLLIIGEHNFVSKYSGSFRSRVHFGAKEKLMTNMLKYEGKPRQLFAYTTDFRTKKAVYDQVSQEEAPYFVIYSGVIYTFTPLDSNYSSFKKKILKGVHHKTYTYQMVLEDRSIRNHYVELLNEYIKQFLWSKKLAFQRDYHRYYFRVPKDEDSLSVNVTTRKRGHPSDKIVVRKYEYGKLAFFRHVALECKHTFIGKDIYLIVFPKYYFSKDGREALDPADISKLTNFLTAREFNNHVCDWLHFWWSYLSGGRDSILIYEDPAYRSLQHVQSQSFYNKHLRLTLSRYKLFDVDFTIPLDVKPRKIAEAENNQPQQGLLF